VGVKNIGFAFASAVRHCHLLSGASSSCGCYAREATSLVKKVHGCSKSKTYKVWTEIIARCENSSSGIYKYYGGRGVTMCKRWRESFQNFLQDMGERPVGKQIDRIDNDGNYEPGNCRWVTPKENNQNRRNTIHLTHNGITKTLAEWSNSLGVKYKTLYRRIFIAKKPLSEALLVGGKA
jgi:hypothetical protein